VPTSGSARLLWRALAVRLTDLRREHKVEMGQNDKLSFRRDRRPKGRLVLDRKRGEQALKVFVRRNQNKVSASDNVQSGLLISAHIGRHLLTLAQVWRVEVSCGVLPAESSSFNNAIVMKGEKLRIATTN
jgi:hypothetical protein